MDQRRSYRSAKRTAQAAATRERLLAAARTQLARRGYADASLEAIAEGAGVSVQRLYAIYGSKPALLMALIRALKDEVGVNDRVRTLLGDRDPRRTLAAVASLTRDYCARGLAVLEAAQQAARADRAVRRVWDEVEGWRHRGNRAVIRSLADRRALRRGGSIASATDALWVLTSHELYARCAARRWSSARYERWLRDTLVRELLG